MIELAVATGIPVREWREEDEQTVVTAIAVLVAQQEALERHSSRGARGSDPEGVQYSG